jgi:hypothetical protein
VSRRWRPQSLNSRDSPESEVSDAEFQEQEPLMNAAPLGTCNILSSQRVIRIPVRSRRESRWSTTERTVREALLAEGQPLHYSCYRQATDSSNCNSSSYTCVRTLEKLWTVINSCVLNCECNKLPSWIEPEYVTIYTEYEFLCSLCLSPGSEYSLHQIWLESVKGLKS